MHRTITALAVTAAVAFAAGCGGGGGSAEAPATTAAPAPSTAQVKWAQARSDLAFYCKRSPNDTGEAGVRAVNDVAAMIDVAKADPGGEAPEGGTYLAGLTEVAADLADCNGDLAGYASVGLATVE